MNTPADHADVEAPRIGPDEISQILQTFAGSEWSGMQLTVGDVTVSAGKDSPPPERRHGAGAPGVAEISGQAPTSPPAPARDTTTTAGSPTTPATPAAAPTIAPPAADVLDETGLVTVSSPTVGSFWAAPDPGSPPFVDIGTRVAAGDQLAIVEVMKLMNPVVTDVAGEVVAIRARNADMVEFGQALFLIRPDE
ncbi:biotin/lipoyl-containing protein [Gordonia soli]|uniref:Biotin carboxyl carrier protein of acetyl-CoA carboxylase n=1 Tax=Gordonia soli NBRC 108243 TaxID=1223545 RepID=M0QG16_9ACTN|nr:biotin/lipoyl-containing protein [Gordonia soli]GAC67374.1 putative biotin carboxyl carrier protein [Gordonia soli NBRC 108243]